MSNQLFKISLYTMKHIRCEYEIAITGSCPLRVASFEYRFYCMADICFGCNIAVCNGRFVIFIRNQFTHNWQLCKNVCFVDVYVYD